MAGKRSRWAIHPDFWGVKGEEVGLGGGLGWGGGGDGGHCYPLYPVRKVRTGTHCTIIQLVLNTN